MTTPIVHVSTALAVQLQSLQGYVYHSDVLLLSSDVSFTSYLHKSLSTSINQIYIRPSRFLLGGTPDPHQAEKNSPEKVVELRTGGYIFWLMYTDAIPSV